MYFFGYSWMYFSTHGNAFVRNRWTFFGTKTIRSICTIDNEKMNFIDIIKVEKQLISVWWAVIISSYDSFSLSNVRVPLNEFESDNVYAVNFLANPIELDKQFKQEKKSLCLYIYIYDKYHSSCCAHNEWKRHLCKAIIIQSLHGTPNEY